MLEEHCCPWWLAYTFDHPLRKLFQDPARVVGPYLKDGMTALDIGCGMGFFSIAMARMVGPGGRVISADLQERMIEVMLKRARRAGVDGRISTALCKKGDIGVMEPVDFALSMWMVHEVQDQSSLFEQVRKLMKPDSRWLIAEPKMHVKQAALDKSLALAALKGFKVIERPKVGLSIAALLGPA